MASNDSDLVYAGFWQRFGASFLDGLLLYLMMLVILLLAYSGSDFSDLAASPGILGLLVAYALPPR